MALTQVDPGLLNSQAQYTGFKNRIINGAMVIDQRNNGNVLSVPPVTSLYGADRWNYGWVTGCTFSVQQVADAPSGYKYSSKMTVTTSTTANDWGWANQPIEANNVFDLAWGASTGSSVALSMWVKSSLVGTFTGGVRYSGPTAYYYYWFPVTVSQANTWTQVVVNIPAPPTAAGAFASAMNTEYLRLIVMANTSSGFVTTATANQWTTTAGKISGSIDFASNLNATFQYTGVQLEKGSTATSFDYRPYGTELALCQRYYFRNAPLANGYAYGPAVVLSTTQAQGFIPYPVPMRAKPSALEQSGTAGDYAVYGSAGTTTSTSVPIFSAFTTEYQGSVLFTTGATLTAGQSSMLRSLGVTSYLGWSAEL